MIELRDVTIAGGTFVLPGIHLQIESGEYAVLMGTTGRGKTTLLESICGLRPVAAGQVLIHGQDVTRWTPGDCEIGYVSQDIALFPTLTVREHLEFALRLRGRSRETLAARTIELSEMLGIGHLLNRTTIGLSGGESQRVALGRALSFRPRVLLLDEPLSALDEATRKDMHELLRLVKTSTGVTTLHVTHNLSESESLADRCYWLGADGIQARPINK